MPLDPSLALQFRLPQAETPFQSLGGMLTLRSELMKQDEAQRAIETRRAFEAEVQALPEEARTTENLVRIASKYAPAKDVLHYGQQSLDKQAQIQAVKEAATARLQQAATQADRMFQLKIDAAKDAQEKTYWQQQRDQVRLQLEAERVRQGAGRLFYDTGVDYRGSVPSASVPAPQAPVGAPSGRGGVVAQVPDEAAGMAMAQGMMGQGRPFTLGVGHMPESVITQGAPQAPAPSPVPAPQETPLIQPPPDNLDARDLRARQGQGVPGVRAATEAVLTSQMPPEVQKLYDEAKTGKEKAKIKAQWDAGVVKAEIERVKQLQGSKASEDTVKAISEGRMQPPTGFALRSPYWQDVMERVNKQNPKFDATTFGARQAARRTFASGPEARNVTALNTVIGHLGTLDEAAQALNNNNVRLANAVFNRMATEIGDPRVQNFDTARQAVAEETMRVFRQVGASEREAREWGDRITSSGSPAQLRGVINTLGQLLESRVEAIAQQYERTVNEQGNPSRIDPKNRKLLDELKKPLENKSKVDSLIDKYAPK